MPNPFPNMENPVTATYLAYTGWRCQSLGMSGSQAVYTLHVLYVQGSILGRIYACGPSYMHTCIHTGMHTHIRISMHLHIYACIRTILNSSEPLAHRPGTQSEPDLIQDTIFSGSCRCAVQGYLGCKITQDNPLKHVKLESQAATDTITALKFAGFLLVLISRE